MKGTPEYTQATVAWDHKKDRVDPTDITVVEDIGISFAAKDGSTYGEFRILWHDFERREKDDMISFFPRSPRDNDPSVELQVYQDGLGAFLDPRIQRVVQRIKRASRFDSKRWRTVAPSPAKVIQFLEDEGVRPSKYQRRGRGERVDVS